MRDAHVSVLNTKKEPPRVATQAGKGAVRWHNKSQSSVRLRWDLCRRVDIAALADAGGKLPADATRVVKPVYASPMRVQVRLLP